MIWCHMGGRSQIPCLSFGRGLTHVPIFSGRLGKRCLRRTDVAGNLTFLSEGVTLRVNVSVNSSEKKTHYFGHAGFFSRAGLGGVKGGSAAQSIVIPEGLESPLFAYLTAACSRLGQSLQAMRAWHQHVRYTHFPCAYYHVLLCVFELVNLSGVSIRGYVYGWLRHNWHQSQCQDITVKSECRPSAVVPTSLRWCSGLFEDGQVMYTYGVDEGEERLRA
ncbi:hypothetical protein EDD15DRAFT_1486360 [Pisolithus albus]|nr:hypothetical protein EDD15DRAFT_1486360 [Pisolithus albus]